MIFVIGIILFIISIFIISYERTDKHETMKDIDPRSTPPMKGTKGYRQMDLDDKKWERMRETYNLFEYDAKKIVNDVINRMCKFPGVEPYHDSANRWYLRLNVLITQPVGWSCDIRKKYTPQKAQVIVSLDKLSICQTKNLFWTNVGNESEINIIKSDKEILSQKESGTFYFYWCMEKTTKIFADGTSIIESTINDKPYDSCCYLEDENGNQICLQSLGDEIRNRIIDLWFDYRNRGYEFYEDAREYSAFYRMHKINYSKYHSR